MIGGNLSQGTPLSLHITVGGFSPTERSCPTRGGAREGDSLWITGLPGRAAAGRALLQSGHQRDPRADSLVRSWRQPPKHWPLMSRLASEVELHAAIDLSDGFWMDASRLARASHVALSIDLEGLSLGDTLRWAAELKGCDPLSWVLAGGEDYEVLIAAPGNPPQWAVEQGVRRIGVVREGAPAVEFLRGGKVWHPEFSTEGWDPFR